MDFKQLMIQHGEKVALGVSIGLCALYFLVGVALGSTDPTRAAEDKGRQVGSAIGSNPAPDFPKPDYLAMAKGPWEKVAEAKPGKDGNVYFKTEMVLVVQEEGPKGGYKEVQRFKIHKAPTMQPAAASIGKVSLKWTKHAETTATLANYQVHRKMEGEKDWTMVQELSGADAGWDDTNVEAKRAYSYKVKSLTKDKDPAKVDSFEQWSNEVAVRTVSDIEVLLKGGSVEKAQIVVRKFMNLQWEQQSFIVEPGNEIGTPIKRWKGREQITVDFSTHYKLLELKKEKREVILEEEVPEKDEQGNIKRVKREKKFEKEALKMIFLDDEGKKHEAWQAE